MGSGKGYLSQHLALSHGLCVVGVDAQITNTQGACRRNEKVCTVELPNNGHIGTSHLVLYREVVLSLEVKMC